MADSAVLAEAVETLARDRALPEPVMILEAGCGSTSHQEWPFDAVIAGIDVDPEQLEYNKRVTRKILGDLQSFELPPNEFDIVVCVDVLEHLRFPEKALANMTRTVKPGGYLLLAGPEPYSYKGLVAKYTPHRMRHFIYGLLTGNSHTVLLQNGIHKTFFPTYLKPMCSLNRMRETAERSSLKILFSKGYDAHSGGLHPRYKPLIGVVKHLTRWIELATGGRTNLLLADFVLVLKKEEGAGQSEHHACLSAN
jgi:SAM-dependent methyltransferase